MAAYRRASLPGQDPDTHILREAFDYPYHLIAHTIRVTDANARQLVSRARKHLASERCESVSVAAHHRLVAAFTSAAQSGDMRVLEELLAADALC